MDTSYRTNRTQMKATWAWLHRASSPNGLVERPGEEDQQLGLVLLLWALLLTSIVELRLKVSDSRRIANAQFTR